VASRTLADLLLDPEAASRIELRGTVPSAVLVALYERDGELYTVLTERRNDLSRHAGEISFPGGRHDPDDADLVATALREADEEIGLRPSKVTVIGGLQPTPTMVTGYAIYPFVGMISPKQRWRPNGGEVALVLELSLAALAAGYERRRIVRRGMPIWTDTYLVDEHLVWGATARILADLLERVAAL
jgi:8-oxo-dGTP pyrophosphatase MutT (NUDIX family)